MRCKLVIIADDLTGANDTGVQFIKNGQKVFVTSQLYFKDIEQEMLKNDILVINTESRFLNKEIAYNKLFELGLFLKNKKVESIYKKIDSTFRGNIKEEILGLKNSLGLEKTFVVSAFPKVKRQVVNGNIFVNGELLENSVFAKDPKNPIKKSFIPEILQIQNYNIIRASDIKESELLKEYIIFDSFDDSDLKMISKFLNAYDENYLLVGTGGLAEYLNINFIPKINILMSGSANEVSHNQILELLQDEKILSHVINLKNLKIDSTKVIKEVIQKFEKSLQEKKDFLIYSEKNLSYNQVQEDSYILMNAIKKISNELLTRYSSNINNIFITGGDTAINVLEANQINGITIKGEIEPGIPYGKIIYNQNEYIIVTKAGGFGQPHSLKNVLKFFRGVETNEKNR